MLLVDTNILLDVVNRDENWVSWSAGQLRMQGRVHQLLLNPVVYAEVSPAYASPRALDAHLEGIGFAYREIPREALYIAGLAHRYYRREGGPRTSILADFLIGAHAAVLRCGILTRDARRYRRYFPRVPLVTP
ncbi:MAG: type II toxin-antitoxin system VapC family toxin [Steroidobacteraceae bacterium]